MKTFERAKTASFWETLTALLGAGAASHVGMNAAMKGVREFSKKIYPKYQKNMLGDGIVRGLRGDKKRWTQEIAETWTAPENFINERVGREIGSSLRGLSTGQRYRALKKLRKEVALTPEIRDAPVFKDLVGGVNRALNEGLPKAEPIQAPNLFDRTAPISASLAIGALHPYSLVHAGTNRLRIATAHSSLGKDYLKRQAYIGAKTGLGKLPPKTHASDLAKQLIISPSAQDGREAAIALGKTLNANPQRAARLGGALYGIARGNPEVRKLQVNAKDYLTLARSKMKEAPNHPLTAYLKRVAARRIDHEATHRSVKLPDFML